MTEPEFETWDIQFYVPADPVRIRAVQAMLAWTKLRYTGEQELVDTFVGSLDSDLYDMAVLLDGAGWVACALTQVIDQLLEIVNSDFTGDEIVGHMAEVVAQISAQVTEAGGRTR